MEFYIIILSGSQTEALEISKKISEKNKTIPLSPVKKINKEENKNVLLLPLNKLSDGIGFNLPINIFSDYEIEDIEYNNHLNADFSFDIISIKGIDKENIKNFITQIEWSYVINVIIDENNYTDYINKTTIFSIDSPYSIEYEKILKEDLINWISSATKLNLLKQKLEAKVFAKKNNFNEKFLDIPYKKQPKEKILKPSTENLDISFEDLDNSSTNIE